MSKTKFVLFDTDANLYIRKPYGYEETANAGKPGNAFATCALTAKSWSRIHWARETGSLRNTPRRKPVKGSSQPHNHRPLIEIHEIDAAGAVVAKHDCLPVFIDIDTKSQTATEFSVP